MRTVDYSSLILSGQLLRDEALAKLSHPPYPADEARRDFKYVASKLDISEDELTSYFNMEKKFYYDFPNYSSLLNYGDRVLSRLGVTRRGGAF